MSDCSILNIPSYYLGKGSPKAEKGNSLTGRIKRFLINHISRNALLYSLIVIVFVLGVAAGSYMVESLDAEQKSELLKYLDMFLTGLEQWNIEPAVVAQHSVLNNLKIIVFIWFLGLTVIGVPLILLIVFFRGFVMGFTIGFLIQQKAFQGLLITLLAIVPPNIINLPATIIGSAVAVSFSYWLVRGRSRGEALPIFQQFAAYSFVMIIISTLVALAGFIEAYVSPAFIKLISNFTVV